MNPINQTKYRVFGHQLDDIDRVIDTLTLISRADSDTPLEVALAAVCIVRESLCDLTDRIRENQGMEEAE